MFDNLTSRITSVFEKIRKKSFLTEADIESALKEIRIALLEADVAVSVVKDFFEKVKSEAVGEKVLKSVAPEHMVVEIVYQNIVKMLSDDSEIKNPYDKQLRIMLIGLQGSGKTTTAAKLVNYFQKKHNKKSPLLTSVDVLRPAAVDQLKILAESVNANFTDVDIKTDKPLDILSRAMKNSNESDLFILDTAGRLHTDDDLMNELKILKEKFQPNEIFLVADSMTGQDSVNIAKEFNDALSLTGVILTRMDGDPRGGAALSMKFITNCPIRFIGTGEKIDQLDQFNAERVAQKILGMGDILALVEKAKETETDEDLTLAKKIQSGKFDLNDFAYQFSKINKMGGIKKLINYLPGAANLESMMQSKGVSTKVIDKNLAIIRSMTKQERKNPEIIKGSRKKRISLGSGTTIQDVNKLLQQFFQLKEIIKKLQKMPKGNLQSLLKGIIK